MSTQSAKMWHEARKSEKKVLGVMVDMQKRAERRRAYYEKLVKAHCTETCLLVFFYWHCFVNTFIEPHEEGGTLRNSRVIACHVWCYHTFSSARTVHNGSTSIFFLG